MTVFLIRRLLQSLVVIFVMSLLVFSAVFAIGNPVDVLISPEATAAERERTIHQLGLDRPIWEQYFMFVKNAVQGELGDSFVHNRPALKLIMERMPATFELATCSMLIAVLLGIPLGIWAGYKPTKFSGKSIMSGSILFFSLPTFWVGLMMILIFAVHLTWLPTIGRGETVTLLGMRLSFLTLDGLKHLIMPAVNLGLYPLALIIRLTASGVRETLPLDFVKFARAKGIKTRRVIMVHVLKNILIPIVTVIGLQFSVILAFAVITESIFAWPGMGKLLIDSITLLDRPVLVAYMLVVVVVFITINIIVDIFYSVLDPRVRIGGL